VGETTLTLPFEAEQGRALDAAFAKLLTTFAAKQAPDWKPRRLDMMEARFSGEAVTQLEFFCNPNAHTTAFDAKLLVTVKTRDGVSVTTEARFSNIKADLDAFLSSVQ
jgi:hypothetical protein